jgi:hypothetical protein
VGAWITTSGLESQRSSSPHAAAQSTDSNINILGAAEVVVAPIRT